MFACSLICCRHYLQISTWVSDFAHDILVKKKLATSTHANRRSKYATKQCFARVTACRMQLHCETQFDISYLSYKMFLYITYLVDVALLKQFCAIYWCEIVQDAETDESQDNADSSSSSLCAPRKIEYLKAQWYQQFIVYGRWKRLIVWVSDSWNVQW